MCYFDDVVVFVVGAAAVSTDAVTFVVFSQHLFACLRTRSHPFYLENNSFIRKQ